MSEINIYLVRHGFSCANLLKEIKSFKFATSVLTNTKFKDPHLTNLGIIGSVLAGRYLQDNQLSNVTFDKIYCSPLIRTWETVASMFSGKYHEAEVAPYLREKNKVETFTNFSKTGIWDIPFSCQENQTRFLKFKDFLKNLEIFLTNQNTLTYYKNKSNDIKKFNITCQPNYDDTYTKKGKIDNFLSWYQEQKRDDKNILVVCHKTLIKEFVNKYDKKISIKNRNNFCYKLTIKSNGEREISVVYDGVAVPNLKKMEKIEFSLSLCSSDKDNYQEELEKLILK